MPDPNPPALPLAALAVVALALVALAGCATGRPTFELAPNPPGCASVVQLHSQDPGLPVDSMPSPRGLLFPPVADRGAESERIIITFLVDETGVPVPETVVVSGARLPATKRDLTEASQEWRFKPARVGECWVPAPFSYQVIMR